MKPLNDLEAFHPFSIPSFLPGQADYQLPIRQIKTLADGTPVKIALLNLISNPKLISQAAFALAKLMPNSVDLFVMPDGKALGLLYALQMLTGRPAVVARKEPRSYMRAPILSSVEAAESMTTAEKHHFYIDADDIALIQQAQHIGFLDDVVSRGDTLAALQRLVGLCDNQIRTVLAVATEGAEPYPGVIALGHLPLF